MTQDCHNHPILCSMWHFFFLYSWLGHVLCFEMLTRGRKKVRQREREREREGEIEKKWINREREYEWKRGCVTKWIRDRERERERENDIEW